MKRVISVLLVIAVMFSLSACGEGKEKESKTMDDIPAESTSQSDMEEASDESAEDTASDNIVSMPTWADERNLIVYFSRVGNTEYPEGIDASTSASIVIDKDTFGTTEYVARMIQESVGGDITYCEAHHNMAIFYAQTYNPDLSVDVIPVGKVTSDLSVFDTLGSREEITFSLVE